MDVIIKSFFTVLDCRKPQGVKKDFTSPQTQPLDTGYKKRAEKLTLSGYTTELTCLTNEALFLL